MVNGVFSWTPKQNASLGPPPQGEWMVHPLRVGRFRKRGFSEAGEVI